MIKRTITHRNKQEQLTRDIETLRMHNGAFEGSLTIAEKEALGRLMRAGKATLEQYDANPFGQGAVIRLSDEIHEEDYFSEKQIKRRIWKVMIWSSVFTIIACVLMVVFVIWVKF